MSKINYLYDVQSIASNSLRVSNPRINEDYIDEKLSEVSGGGVSEEVIDNKIKQLTKDAPEALDTFKEIADALGNDSDAIGAINTALSGKVDSDDVYTKDETDTKFVTKDELDDTLNDYVSISGHPSGHGAPAVNSFAMKSDLANYLLKTDASETYATLDGMNERLTESQVNEMVTDMLAVYVTRETMQNECQPKGDYATMTDIPDLSEYAKTSALDDYLLKEDASNSYQPVGEYLVKSDLDGYAKQTDIPAMPDVPTKVSELENDSEFLVAADLDEYAKKSDVPENISAFTNDAGYLTEHQSLDEYATKSDLDSYQPVGDYQPAGEYLTVADVEHFATEAYVDGRIGALGVVTVPEHWTLNGFTYDSDPTFEESDDYDFIYDEESWNASFEGGALKKYYTKYPDEDRYNTNENRWAVASDKVNGEWPEYCVQCWEGAISAEGAKFPWVCPNFDTDVNSKIIFRYDGEEDVMPWGDNLFGIGRKTDGSDRMWGIASVGEEFRNNSFLLPQQKNGQDVYNGNPEWSGNAGDQNFDITKFHMILEHQDVEHFDETDAKYSVKEYVDNMFDGIVDGAPAALDTLKEIADKLGENDNVSATIITQLGDKANADSVYTKTVSDAKYVDKSKYDELNDKYNTLFNYVYSNASGSAATPLNADYVENNLSPTNTSVTVTEGELGDVTIPETNKTMTVTAPMQDGSTVTLTSSRSFNLINTSDEPVNVTIDAPTPTGSNPTVSLSGDFDTLTVNNASVGAKSGADPLTATNVVVESDAGKNATVSGVVFEDNATISTTTVPSLGVANSNTAQNAPSATINAENSTVTLNKGEWDTLNSNVSDTTLVVTQNCHIGTLNVVKGNVIVNDCEVSNRIDNVVNGTEYTVDVNRKTATTGAELNNYMTGNPGVITMGNDITRGRITWGIFGSGNYKLDLAGHTLTIEDATLGIKTRNTVNLTIVDTVGGGKLISNKSYALWAGENTTITVDVPDSTEIIGVTHTLYAEGSGHPTINVKGGSFKAYVPDGETPELDVNGNYKFLVNHYDATYTREGNCFNITGGKFYGFNPMESYGEPGSPVNLLPQGYTVNHTVEDGVDVYEVVEA